MYSISTERHRAEVRRATNDEKLTTISDRYDPEIVFIFVQFFYLCVRGIELHKSHYFSCSICGPDVSSEWQIEGRRLVPLMPRLVPQTAFTLTANSAANIQAEKNAALPIPSVTGNKECTCCCYCTGYEIN